MTEALTDRLDQPDAKEIVRERPTHVAIMAIALSLALSLGGCLEIEEVGVSDHMSAQAATDIINVFAQYEKPASCRKLGEDIYEQAARYDPTILSDDKILLKDGATTITLWMGVVNERTMKVRVKFNRLENEEWEEQAREAGETDEMNSLHHMPPAPKGAFVGEIAVGCTPNPQQND